VGPAQWQPPGSGVRLPTTPPRMRPGAPGPVGRPVAAPPGYPHINKIVLASAFLLVAGLVVSSQAVSMLLEEGTVPRPGAAPVPPSSGTTSAAPVTGLPYDLVDKSGRAFP